jgi:hypothetical protein
MISAYVHASAEHCDLLALAGISYVPQFADWSSCISAFPVVVFLSISDLLCLYSVFIISNVSLPYPFYMQNNKSSLFDGWHRLGKGRFSPERTSL